jgi:hypothetical protein
MEPPHGPERTVLSVPLERTGASSSGRTWLVVAAWVLGLTGVATIGIGGRERGEAPPIAPAAIVPTEAAPTVVPNRAVPRAAAPIVYYRSLGDDGLVGGIVFGDNVPAASGPATSSRHLLPAAPGGASRSSRGAPRSSS